MICTEILPYKLCIWPPIVSQPKNMKTKPMSEKAFLKNAFPWKLIQHKKEES
jgi:hypothetical protein